MRKVILLFFILLFSNSLALSKELVIGDKLFITTMNDIYTNLEEVYADTTVRFQGRLDRGPLPDPECEKLFAFVYRQGPGCCYNDAYAGMYLDYQGKLPEDGSWVEVSGKPYFYEHRDFADLFLKVDSIKVCAHEGKFQVKD